MHCRAGASGCASRSGYGILIFRMLPLVVMLAPLYLLLMAAHLLDTPRAWSSGSPRSGCRSRSG